VKTRHKISRMKAVISALVDQFDVEKRQLKTENQQLRNQLLMRETTINALGSQFNEMAEDLRNARFLLRQIYYARCSIGTKFCDELDRWALDDLDEPILQAIGERPKQTVKQEVV
jgi:hypothetical protein